LFEQQEAIAGVARANERQQNRDRFITLPPYPEETEDDRPATVNDSVRVEPEQREVAELVDFTRPAYPFNLQPFDEFGEGLRGQ
jgi:hypothetical protein